MYKWKQDKKRLNESIAIGPTLSFKAPFPVFITLDKCVLFEVSFMAKIW